MLPPSCLCMCMLIFVAVTVHVLFLLERVMNAVQVVHAGANWLRATRPSHPCCAWSSRRFRGCDWRGYPFALPSPPQLFWRCSYALRQGGYGVGLGPHDWQEGIGGAGALLGIAEDIDIAELKQSTERKKQYFFINSVFFLFICLFLFVY